MYNPLTVYKASAGAGKTFRLAVEYIKLLVLAPQGDEYTHILAVTFTNKATAEMKDRIISQLFGIANSLPSSQPYFNALCEALSETQGAPSEEHEIRQRCQRALYQILHDYSRFRVETIDSFFQTILRGLALELGLTANLQVEINDTEVLSEAVDRIIDRLQDEPLILGWLLSLVRDQIENNQRWDVTRRVKSFGKVIFNEEYLRRGDALRAVLSDHAFVQDFMNKMNQQVKDTEALVREYGERMRQALAENGVVPADFSNGARNLQPFLTKLCEGRVADLNFTDTLQAWIADPMKMVKKADVSRRPDLIDAADIIAGLLGEVQENLSKWQYDVNSARQALAHLKPLFLLDSIDREVASINVETSRFNLAKTPILLARMVGESDAPFVFEKIGALLHHVMIDEFQDTSRLQWDNFRALLLESYSRGGHNLIVGDVKQSIYRWRGGDWRILGDIEQNVVPAPDVRTLRTNRRSLRRVIEFNNNFFQMACKKLEGVSQSEEELLNLPDFFLRAYSDVEQEVPANKGNEGYVRVEVISSEEYKIKEEAQQKAIEGLCQQIRVLHDGGVPYEQMAILVRINVECELIVQAFAEIPDMPPIISDEAFLLSSSIPVVILIEALRYLVDGNVLSAFYLQEHDVEVALLDRQRQLLMLTPLYELLEELYRILHLDRFSSQDAYLFGFFDAVSDYLHGEAADIPSFLTFWDDKLSRQAIPAGEVEGIRILTIHKAKGLEYHTVLLPFCTWAMERNRASDLLWCTPAEKPFADMQLLPITPSSKLTPNSVFARDYAESHILARMDELNTLYVAFTRARANLLVWCVDGDMMSENRTVGDLIASSIQHVASLATDGVYVEGEPVFATETEVAQAENRMEPTAMPLRVSMFSCNLGVEFRQSNESARFLQAEQGGGELSQDQRQQRRYLETGRLLHRVLQSIGVEEDLPAVLDTFEHKGLITRTAADGTEVAVPRSAMEKWVKSGWRNPLVREWFQPHWKLFNECSIVSLDERQQPVTHRPDRVMVSADGSHIVVVDFKFGTMHPDYEQQVLTYMDLLRQMAPEAHVEGYLWFVYTGKVLSVPLSAASTAPDAATDNSQLTLDF
ncbi:MAG: UvrD-helicase domain-containing protein [Bacteroidaceae bacterium]|nr:UvrD-helicase domain-containing protein [Bacteroidaceae bacterium]